MENSGYSLSKTNKYFLLFAILFQILLSMILIIGHGFDIKVIITQVVSSISNFIVLFLFPYLISWILFMVFRRFLKLFNSIIQVSLAFLLLFTYNNYDNFIISYAKIDEIIQIYENENLDSNQRNKEALIQYSILIKHSSGKRKEFYELWRDNLQVSYKIEGKWIQLTRDIRELDLYNTLNINQFNRSKTMMEDFIDTSNSYIDYLTSIKPYYISQLNDFDLVSISQSSDEYRLINSILIGLNNNNDTTETNILLNYFIELTKNKMSLFNFIWDNKNRLKVINDEVIIEDDQISKQHDIIIEQILRVEDKIVELSNKIQSKK